MKKTSKKMFAYKQKSKTFMLVGDVTLSWYENMLGSLSGREKCEKGKLHIKCIFYSFLAIFVGFPGDFIYYSVRWQGVLKCMTVSPSLVSSLPPPPNALRPHQRIVDTLLKCMESLPYLLYEKDDDYIFYSDFPRFSFP